MLKHLGEDDAASRIQHGLNEVYRSKEKCTRDIGGQSGTTAFADSVIEAMQSESDRKPKSAASVS
jgi:isocitrate dehydrogenase (NAD+)